MRSYITAFMLAITLALASCGGGNDVASSGATAVSAAAPVTTTTASPTPTTTPTEAKVNGQIDERTGVAPVVAAMTIAQTVEACTASGTYGGTGALLTATTAPTLAQCAAALPGIATGNPWTVYSNGGCWNSSNFSGGGPTLTSAQNNACGGGWSPTAYGGCMPNMMALPLALLQSCVGAAGNVSSSQQCSALGGSWSCSFLGSYACGNVVGNISCW